MKHASPDESQIGHTTAPEAISPTGFRETSASCDISFTPVKTLLEQLTATMLL